MDKEMMLKVMEYLRSMKSGMLGPSAETPLPLQGGPVPTFNNQGQGQGAVQNAAQAVVPRARDAQIRAALAASGG